jgi:hypothetical protein
MDMLYRSVFMLFATAMALSHLESAVAGSLNIRVIDYASVPSETLQRAASIAESVYSQAGLETVWKTCEAGPDRRACTASGVESELIVKILAPGMEDPRISPHLLGTTNRDVSASFVFYGHVRVSKLGANGHGPELLAAVMAHEAAHLLGLEHSEAGVMRDSFRPIDIDRLADRCLTFTAGQSEQLRGTIVARLERARLAWLASRPAPAGARELASNSWLGSKPK